MKKNLVIAAIVVVTLSAVFGIVTGAGTAFTAMLLVGSIYNQMRRAEGMTKDAAYAKACSLEDNGKIIACEEQSERDYKVVSLDNGKQILLSRPAQHK